MTVGTFVRHQVNDFAAWKKVYDESRPLREGIVIAESVLRDPDDPNTIIVYHQYSDLKSARAFVESATNGANKEVLERAGVQPETLELWFGEDV